MSEEKIKWNDVYSCYRVVFEKDKKEYRVNARNEKTAEFVACFAHIENVPDIYGYTSNPFNRPDTSFFVKEVYNDIDATEQEVFHALSCEKVETYLRDTWKTQGKYGDAEEEKINRFRRIALALNFTEILEIEKEMNSETS